MKVNTSMIPPGGYFMMDRDIKISGPTFEGLVTALSKFRKQNDYPEGAPLIEATEAICKRAPGYCKGGPHPSESFKPKIAHHNKPRLMDRVGVWAKELIKGKMPEKVDPLTAQKRIQICINCPKNRKWDTCASCGALKRDINNLLNTITPKREMIGGCQDLGIDCGAAVWLKKEDVRRGGSSEVRECWLHKSS